jgi:RND family efflux transporter MFP subunit
MNRSLQTSFLLLLGGLACGFLFPGCRRAAPAEEEEVPPAPVKAVHAEFAEFGEWTELIGATQALPGHVARITAPVEGHVVSVLKDDTDRPVAEGQAVQKDQLIVRLDDRVARAQRDKALAMLSELLELRTQADLEYQVKSLDLDRLTKLVPAGTPQTSLPLVSKIEIDKARLAQEDAQSKQRAVAAKGKTLGAELRGLEAHLEYHQLRAPIKGVLGPLQVVPGQTLAVGATVAEVTDLAEIDVMAFAPPRLATKVRFGQPARFADKSSGDDYEGKVVFIAEQAQPDTGSILVKVRFANKAKLRANQVARVLVQTQAEKKRQTIPTSALMEDQDPPLVVIADEVEIKKHPEHGDEQIGKARKLRAFLGTRDRAENRVEILRLEDPATKKDVPVTDILFIIEGGHGLHDGDPLKVQQKKE